MNIKIIVATHKPYWMPSDPVYLPLHVGAEGKESLGWQGDNTGDNISCKNSNYCELTGLYWAWKNLDADYIGLAHYRRHFSNGKLFGNKKDRVITGAELEKKLAGCDVLLPKLRNYWIETNYSQYTHAHHAIDLDTTRVILSEKFPDYLKAYDDSMRRTTGHRFNMFVMKRDKLDAYCTWMYDVLFELESRLDISFYSTNDARVFGFVSERLLDVWLKTKHVSYREIPYVFMENQNWFIKGGNFLKRKFRY
ncbi:MAG: DUF4422 domain-containing protein [Flexilinea sp.]|nr:DUF4422 domain-containing protein [Flexilinea sp.]